MYKIFFAKKKTINLKLRNIENQSDIIKIQLIISQTFNNSKYHIF